MLRLHAKTSYYLHQVWDNIIFTFTLSRACLNKKLQTLIKSENKNALFSLSFFSGLSTFAAHP